MLGNNEMKKIILLTMFSILIGSTATAQCAWVLWSSTYAKAEVMSMTGQWTIEAAYPDYEQCFARQKKEFLASEPFFREAKWKIKPAEGSVIIKEFEFLGIYKDFKPNFIYQWKCLPDTIDPRK